MAERTADRGRKTLAHVLAEEIRLLRGSVPLRSTTPEAPAAVADVYEAIAGLPEERRLSALCLSGGGIRSATFNLGVLEALARAGVLGSFDYLSTVSGGGYIGAWLEAWMHRERGGSAASPPGSAAAAREAVLSALANESPHDPLHPEPKPIDRLREFSNYLTPRAGFLSMDTWAMAAIVLRNLLLNWLVIVPLLAFAVMIPQAAFLLAAVPDLGDARWSGPLSWAALTIGLASSVASHCTRAKVRAAPLHPDPEVRWAQRRRQRWVSWAFSGASIGSLYLATTLWVLAALWAKRPGDAIPALSDAAGGDFGVCMRRALTWTIAIPLLGATIGRTITRRWPRSWIELLAELMAFVLAGLTGAALLAWLMGEPWKTLVGQPWLATVLGVPCLLVIDAAATAVFTAVRSLPDDYGAARQALAAADREWWSRLTGRALLLAAFWAGSSALVLVGVWTLGHAGAARAWLSTSIGPAAAAMGGTAAVVAALLGKSSHTSAGRAPAAGTAQPEVRPQQGDGDVAEWTLRIAAAVAIGCAIILLSLGTAWLGRQITGDGCLLALGSADEAAVNAPPRCPPVLGADGRETRTIVRPLARGWDELGRFLALGGGLVLLSAVAGFFVNVNRFSLHGMYRNRLVRAYLGASNTDRRPNPVSGFDPEDDALRLSDLRPSPGEEARLFPIVNTTVNLVSGERLAWQERRAESFSMTPLFCGNFHQGYRDTLLYAQRDGGIRLGAAMAISGAAANPNMGYGSTPALTFLMGLLNARLGVWLPNPGDEGANVVSQPAPRHASVHLALELLGLTDSFSRWVNVSDGGHFDNLGLYEVVLRRCRFVVVSDAGCDRTHGYGDLGNAIRKIRVDFGIPIEFESEILIPARGADGRPGEGALCALGAISYEAVDGRGAKPGVLVYLKPTLASWPPKTVPYDVKTYANSSAAFPHESTIDQWFSESQFESYRALGEHVLRSILGTDARVTDWTDFEERVRAHLASGKGEPRRPVSLKVAGGSGGAAGG